MSSSNTLPIDSGATTDTKFFVEHSRTELPANEAGLDVDQLVSLLTENRITAQMFVPRLEAPPRDKQELYYLLHSKIVAAEVVDIMKHFRSIKSGGRLASMWRKAVSQSKTGSTIDTDVADRLYHQLEPALQNIRARLCRARKAASKKKSRERSRSKQVEKFLRSQVRTKSGRVSKPRKHKDM
eukprot:m.309025 g.309025  ORF g.309025 m.309025 type:complete len:183 (+) comp22268_c0_seq1:133-681(+)